MRYFCKGGCPLTFLLLLSLICDPSVPDLSAHVTHQHH